MHLRSIHWIGRLLASLAIVALGSASATAAEFRRDWSPAKTWVFVVGLLEWQHSDMWPSFPDCMVDRRDEQFVEFFRSAGVPSDQITYLQDSEATKHAIQTAFVEMLDETDENDLLVVYFCGHGYRDVDSGQTWFACYDAAAKDSTAWSVRSIFSTIEKHFSGDRALLMADCCHSGALYDEARNHRDSHIAYAALTSSYSHSTSTGNWTFSDCVLAGLYGDPVVDINGDRVIELNEIARYTELEMAFVEGQKSMFVASDRFPREAKLVAVKGTASTGVGDRIEVDYRGKWYRAKVIAAQDGQMRVHYVGFDRSWDEWVTPDRVRPYQAPQFGEGDKVQVYWPRDKKWYPATVLKGWYGLHLIRYDGYDAGTDEWVSRDLIHRRQN
jgi:hypothetical protein